MSLLHPASQNLVSNHTNQQPRPGIDRNVNNLKIYKVENIIDSYASWGQHKYKYKVK